MIDSITHHYSRKWLENKYTLTVSKIRKKVYRSDIKVIFELYSHFRSFIPNKTMFITYCLSGLPGSFKIHWVRQLLVHFMVVVGIVNATVYRTEPIFMDLGHSKMSQFLTLQLYYPKWHTRAYSLKRHTTFIEDNVPRQYIISWITDDMPFWHTDENWLHVELAITTDCEIAWAL